MHILTQVKSQESIELLMATKVNLRDQEMSFKVVWNPRRWVATILAGQNGSVQVSSREFCEKTAKPQEWFWM